MQDSRNGGAAKEAGEGAGHAGQPPHLDEVWRGGVNTWECDEMGHMNTRFYVARAMDALVPFFARLGLPGLFAPGASTTAVLRDMHIRFLREVHAATPLSIGGGVLSHDADTVEILLLMSGGGDGELKASFRLRLAHVAADDPTRTVPWPEPFGAQAQAFRTELPPQSAPRGTRAGPVEATRASLEEAERLGLKRIALDAIGPERADAFGRMKAGQFIAAVSDGIRSLTEPVRRIVVANSDNPPARYGGAVLEFRIVHHDWPRIGDCYEIRSGLQKAEGTVQSLIHWMLDPVSGRVLGTMQSIAVIFDLDARKAVRVSPKAASLLAEKEIRELDL